MYTDKEKKNKNKVIRSSSVPINYCLNVGNEVTSFFATSDTPLVLLKARGISRLAEHANYARQLGVL